MPTIKKSMSRFNVLIREDQQKFIKAKCKVEKKSQGETLREIVDFYINKSKK